jgi:hydroxymethylglutaryl-CoA lyase
VIDSPGLWASLPERVRVVEVGPRDGFQNLARIVPTADKVRITNELLVLGFDRVEVTSFVHPVAVPQMADADDVARLARRDGARIMVLVPNARGTLRALAHAPDMVNFVLSASESHNQANLNASVAKSLEDFRASSVLATEAGVPVRITIATSFGCPYEGWVDPARVIDLVRAAEDAGAAEICLGDTTGMANPRQVFDLFTAVWGVVGSAQLAVHLHNTRGAGAANLLAALQAGVTVFDAAFGGLGGCPYAPGATGNVCTEDMVQMVHEMGIQTGVDLPGLIEVALMAEGLLGVELPGQVMRAGPTSSVAPR